MERTKAPLAGRPAQQLGGRPLDQVRQSLLEALYLQLAPRRIAQLVAQDRDQARREVVAALELALARPEFLCVGTGAGRDALIGSIADQVLGYGPIEGLIVQEGVTEVMVNGPHDVFYERDGKLHRSDADFVDAEQVRAVIDRIVAPLGRRVDEQSPIVNARLPTGDRVNVVIPPIAVDGPAITIRKFGTVTYGLDDLVRMGSLSPEMAQLLTWAVRLRCTVAVSGGTGGGKTTLLNALSDEISPDERIVTIEDSAELRFARHPHVVRLEARPANAEGAGEVTIRDLVINSLRMRPDRIIVGECRGPEALDMLQAMNSGHEGSMTTLHANAVEEVVPRLVMMVRFGIDLPVDVIEEQIASAFDLVVQQDRFADGSRRITQMSELLPARARDAPGARGAGREPVPVGASGAASSLSLVKWERGEGRWTWLSRPTWIGRLIDSNIANAKEVHAWEQSCGLRP